MSTAAEVRLWGRTIGAAVSLREGDRTAEFDYARGLREQRHSGRADPNAVITSSISFSELSTTTGLTPTKN